MAVLKKDLYLIFTKDYVQIFIYICIVMFLRNSSIDTSTFRYDPEILSHVVIIEQSQFFDFSSIVFLFIFFGSRIPKTLILSEESLDTYYFLTPVNNYVFLWSKLIASTIVMLPFLMITLLYFNYLTPGVLLITFAYGIIFMLLMSMSAFTRSGGVSKLISIVVMIGLIAVTFIDNPVIKGINEAITSVLRGGSIEKSQISLIVLQFLLALVLVHMVYRQNIRRRKIHG